MGLKFQCLTYFPDFLESIDYENLISRRQDKRGMLFMNALWSVRLCIHAHIATSLYMYIYIQNYKSVPVYKQHPIHDVFFDIQAT